MEQNASSARNRSEDHRRAATAYLVWPLALATMIREGEAETIWARLHARQALVFGVLASGALFLVLALPLLVLLADSTMSTRTTITVYFAGLVVDVVAALALAVIALRFSARAARGDLFTIPIVTPIVDAVFRLRQP